MWDSATTFWRDLFDAMGMPRKGPPSAVEELDRADLRNEVQCLIERYGFDKVLAELNWLEGWRQ